MSAQLQPRDQDEYVLVRRTRIAALSRALGNPSTVNALEGDTVEDCLVEIAAKRLTFLPRRQVVATSITHNGAHVGNVFTDRDNAYVRMRTLNKNHPDERRELVDLVPAGTFDMLQHLERQRAFSEQTFGPGMRTHGVIDHIRKELREIEAAPSDLSEWIDVAILALDGAWRTGASPQQIIEALVAKQAKNESRQWPDWRTVPAGQAIEHVRASDSANRCADCQTPNSCGGDDKCLEKYISSRFIDMQQEAMQGLSFVEVKACVQAGVRGGGYEAAVKMAEQLLQAKLRGYRAQKAAGGATA